MTAIKRANKDMKIGIGCNLLRVAVKVLFKVLASESDSAAKTRHLSRETWMVDDQ